MPKESIKESSDSAIPAAKQYRLCLLPLTEAKSPDDCFWLHFTRAKLFHFLIFRMALLAVWDTGSCHMSYLCHFIWHLIFLYLWIIPFYVGSRIWVFIYVKCMQMHCCVCLFVCIPCNGHSCPSFLTWGDWFSLDLSVLPLTHVVRPNRACTSQTTWSLFSQGHDSKDPVEAAWLLCGALFKQVSGSDVGH